MQIKLVQAKRVGITERVESLEQRVQELVRLGLLLHHSKLTLASQDTSIILKTFAELPISDETKRGSHS